MELSRFHWQVGEKLSERHQRKDAIVGSLPGAKRKAGMGTEGTSSYNATTVPRCSSCYGEADSCPHPTPASFVLAPFLCIRSGTAATAT